MENYKHFINNSKIVFINKPISNHSWFVLKQNNITYMFYDEHKISAKKLHTFFYRGRRSNLHAAITDWSNHKGDHSHASQET